MKFMMLMIPEGYGEAGPDAVRDLDPEAVEKMMAYNEELEEAEVLRDLAGLHPPSTGARINFEGGEPHVTDGPFAEAKEAVGGYWIIEVGSKEEAVEWAKKCPASEDETIEIRQVQDAADFSDEVREVVERE